MRGASAAGPKSPGIVYSALSAALVVMLALIAVTARQPPPPAIAEFAPQAVQQIKESDLSAHTGSDAAGLRSAQADALDRPNQAEARAAIEVPRVKRCVGDPPRQIEDPQSPPCVPYWDGDNGGATWRGVTRDEVRVVVPSGNYEYKALESFLNNRFQFYGRRLRLIDFIPSGRKGSQPQAGDPALMRADAVRADEQYRPFASTSYTNRFGSEYHYYDELARREILTVSAIATAMTEEENFRRHHPYQWSFVPGYEYMSQNKAAWICSALKDRLAGFAGGAEKGKKRIFGIVYQRAGTQVTPVEQIVDPLSACGVPIADVVEFEAENDATTAGQGSTGAEGRSASSARSAILRMQSRDVTSILCECGALQMANYLMSAATTQGYFPEWLGSTYVQADEDIVRTGGSPEQLADLFGISWHNKHLANQDSPWDWAIREAKGGHSYPNQGLEGYGARFIYLPLLMLASGIQMAGPILTPDSFARGLQSTTFPNPGAGGPPYWQARVGFRPDRHTMVQDGTLFWWSNEERSVIDNEPIAVCYAKHGALDSKGSWPKDSAGLFEPPCY